MTQTHHAPLAGVRIIELSGSGHGVVGSKLLARLGAELICVVRPGGDHGSAQALEPDMKNVRRVAIDLSSPRGADLVRLMCADAEGVIETYRPGVAETLGVGPDDCMATNRALVYGRYNSLPLDAPDPLRCLLFSVGMLAGLLGAAGGGGGRIVDASMIDGLGEVAAAPRIAERRRDIARPRTDIRAVLADYGYRADDINGLISTGTVESCPA